MTKIVSTLAARFLPVATAVTAICAMCNTASAVPWYLDRLDQLNPPLDNLYDPCNSASGQHIYIISSGIDPTHPEFGGRASVYYDAFGGDGIDRVGHGTWLASLAAGSTYGTAKSAFVHGIRAFDDCGRTTTESLTLAFNATAAGAGGIIVVPFALDELNDPALDNAIAFARAIGNVIVVAGGDEDRNACELYPANLTDTVTIGASDRDDVKASWAAYGGCVDAYAPGDDITAAWIGSEPTATINTSGASAALAAGLAAQYRKMGMSSSQTENQLRTCTSGSLLRLCCGVTPPFGPAPAPAAVDVPGMGPNGVLDWYRVVEDLAVCTADLDGDCNVGFSDLSTLLAGWGPCPLGEPRVLGIGGYGHLFEIDMTVGVGTEIGQLGYTGHYFEAMAVDSQNRLYASAEDQTSGDDLLILVDPDTATGSVVATLTGMPAAGEIRGLAFDSGDQLFAIISTGLQQNVHLARIDVETGAVDIVGDTGQWSIEGLAFDSADVLYFVDYWGHGRLGTIDTSTAQPTAIGGTDLGDPKALTFDHAGRLLAAFRDLVEVDPATGNGTSLGSIGGIVRGLGTLRTDAACRLDLDGSGDVGFTDLTQVLSTWGSCD